MTTIEKITNKSGGDVAGFNWSSMLAFSVLMLAFFIASIYVLGASF